MSVFVSFIALISVKNRAIWRGPGIEPTILLDKEPVDYYIFIALFVFASLVLSITMFVVIIGEFRGKRKFKKVV